MALVYSPVTEDALIAAPRVLYPRFAFIMRQLGEPHELDLAMANIVEEVFKERGYGTKDADGSTGSKDFLERILGLIRGTGFTVAIFSEHTRVNAMANIALELGFAAMCGKPLIIVKSKDAVAPSDLTRTDWIIYDPADEERFRAKLGQAVSEVEQMAIFLDDMLSWVMDAPAMDCASAFERASRAFLLTGEARFLDAVEEIGRRLAADARGDKVTDLDRVREEVTMFLRQGRRALAGPEKPKRQRRAPAAQRRPAAA